jgi:GT2 family glycosyltransferase
LKNTSHIEHERLFLVTPLRDELPNIDELIKSIKNQTIPIFCWIIIENDSADGSKEYLKSIKKVSNVVNFNVINLSLNSNEYDIGFKYSNIIQRGFKFIEEHYELRDGDYIGILDADSFPEDRYFEVLIEKLNIDPKLGLVSGVLKLKNGKRDKVSDYTVRGSGRIWKYECYRKTAKYQGLGPDRTTQFRAELQGWRTAVVKEVSFISRELNIRVDYKFRGRSDYYNGCTIPYAICKSIFLLFRNPKKNKRYLLGYMQEYLNNNSKSSDKEILDYNKNNLRRVVKRLINRKLKHS